ncbi:hypothetical protein QJS04_geneDACA015857 [Acorus gramineus]|uniref:Uncharacterized protein n=1 Tax=Acorus gramineus TaxID=55184 RepID=A0AAV9BQ42_ACOGR|nr:hypothetical protein QJS04_geneDACA015857 [Acorus gramineus]
MVLHNFYKGREDLHLLQIDPAKLGEGLVYEGAIEDESKVFPHFYGPERSFGPLDFESVVGVEKLELVGGDFACRFLH